MDKARQYRDLAAQCVLIAEESSNPGHRMLLLEMAHRRRQLADQVERAEIAEHKGRRPPQLAASFFGGNVGLRPTTAPGKDAYLPRRFGFGTEGAIFSACSAAARAKVADASHGGNGVAGAGLVEHERALNKRSIARLMSCLGRPMSPYLRRRFAASAA